MKFLHSLFWMFVFQVTVVYATDTLRVAGPNDIRIVQYLQEYRDCSCKETEEQVVKKWLKGYFRPMKAAPVVNKGVTPCNYWFALVVENQSAKVEEYLWSFYNDGIYFTLYEWDEKLSQTHPYQSQSHYLKLQDRIVPFRAVAFEIPMSPGERKVFLMKTEVFGRQNLYFPTDFTSKSDVLLYELNFSFLLGRYYGFLFFAIIFNLCLFIILKKRFYAMMLGYVVSLLAFLIIEYLHDVYLIPAQFYSFWSKIPKLTYLAFALYFNVYVFLTFVQQPKYFPRLANLLAYVNKIVFYATLAYLLLHIFFINEPDLLDMFQVNFAVLLILQTLVLLLNMYFAIIKRTPFIFHYLLGNTLLYISVVVYLLNAFNLVYIPQFIKPGNMIFAFAVEVIYLMIVFTVKYKIDFDKFSKDIVDGERVRDQLSRELINTQEKERKRIAHDIHDGIGGTLQGLRLLLSTEQLKEKDKIKEMLKNINKDFKELLHQISPKNLETQGLFAAIKTHATQYATDIQVDVQVVGDERLLSWDLKITIYRIYQELMTNALKHAKGLTKIEIDLVIDAVEVRLMVQDNGIGNSVVHATGTEGIGMQSLHSRIDYYRGQLEYYFSDQGCNAHVILPIQELKKD